LCENNFYNLEKLKRYAFRGVALAEREKDSVKIGSFYGYLSVGYMEAKQNDSASYYNNFCMDYAEKTKDDWLLISAKHNRGDLYQLTGDYAKALEIYYGIVPLCEKIGDNRGLLSVFHNISNIHTQNGNFELSEKYLNKAIALASKLNDKLFVGTSYYSLCHINLAQGKAKEALQYAKIARDAFHEVKNDNYEAEALIAMAVSYSEMIPSEYQKTEKYLLQAWEIVKMQSTVRTKISVKSKLADVYLHSKELDKAEKCALEAYQLDSLDESNASNMALVLAGIYYAKGNPDKGFDFMMKFKSIEGGKADKNYQDAMSEMEVKYETEKKEQQIVSMKAEHKLLMWLSIAGGTILLLIVVAMIFRQVWLKKRTQLIATQAVLDGETQERARLARDLHDGLGGMLSAVKINLYQMKQENFIIDKTDVGIFEKALAMLDESVGELRRVAHHLMPESLVRSGLRISLEDFCRALPHTYFEYFGDDRRLEKRLELMFYRCAYELINNAIKHSQAKSINVQLQIAEHSVSLTVSDNGIGFDGEKIVKGSGLDNIRQRVLSYNGKFNIYSEPGKGTEATIDIESIKLIEK
jgi:signal transduction histidine kinase